MARRSTSIPVKHINDITECPICNEIFTDPRVLPCIHTFCCECISKWAEDQNTGGKLACPLCRKEHQFPGGVITGGSERSGSVVDLPKNFFVQKVVNMRKLSNTLSGTDVSCDICREDSDGDQPAASAEVVTKATAYCAECCQNICAQCCAYHRKVKTTSEHRLIKLHDHQLLHGEPLPLELPESQCDKHSGKMLEMYCYDCKVPTCTACLAIYHKMHNFSDIRPIADEVRVQMKADVDGVANSVGECRKLLAKLENANTDFGRKIKTTAELVTETAEKMKQAIDDYKSKLLDELEAAKIRHEAKVDCLHQELEANVLVLEIFKHYSEQVGSKGTACDIVMSATNLHVRANELIQHSVCDGFPPENCLLDVEFSSGFSTDQLQQLLGEIHISDSPTTSHHSTPVYSGSDTTNLSVPADIEQPSGIIPSRSGRSVTGITSLGDEVFVVCHEAENINVYDAGTLRFQRLLPIGHQKAIHSSLAACSRYNCIYMSTFSPNFIHRIDPAASSVNNFAKSWMTGRSPSGIVVNQDANLLVVCRVERKIQEFTTNGGLVREIVLQSDMVAPMHVVQMAGDQFGVTHAHYSRSVGSPLHRFCVVGSDGRVLRSYGGSPGHGNGQLLVPHGLALNADGSGVFLADKQNRRVLMLNLATLSATPLSADRYRHAGGLLNYPYCVHYDRSRGRLFIGEQAILCRVVVVDI